MTPKLQRVQVFLDEALLAKLDEWRIRNMPLESRSKAIARLLEKGMGNATEDDEGGRRH